MYSCMYPLGWYMYRECRDCCYTRLYLENNALLFYVTFLLLIVNIGNICLPHCIINKQSSVVLVCYGLIFIFGFDFNHHCLRKLVKQSWI